ncbi:MAG: hypothetical protein KKH52_04410 [Nanoarchaeota archaeon]|nr:hypothetical protein [Nanoarchaeota archaeon]MBU1974611.1 hypothetical protein [Nanoarchaeota archaeon]
MISYGQAWGVLKPLVLFIFGMTIYAIFIFKFYLFVARRDIFKLNLKQYNRANHSGLKKLVAAFLYIVEYVLLFPLFIFIWFLVITILLTFLSRGQTGTDLLLVSIALVATVRITAYYNEDLSKDLAKMLPFALLGIFLVDISFFSFSNSFNLLKEIPPHWESIIYYLVFVIALEFILRLIHGFVSIFKKDNKEEKNK